MTVKISESISPSEVSDYKEKLCNLFLYKDDVLSEEERAELLLLIGCSKNNFQEKIKALFKKFGNLNNILTAPLDELCSVDGISENTAAVFKVVAACAKRSAMEAVKTKKSSVLENWDLFLDYCRQDMAYNDIEEFKMFLLDENLRYFADKTLSKGTINRTVAHPREIIKTALKHNAKNIILAHNHPSGNCKPSDADVMLTHDICSVAESVGITVFDHLIITNNNIFSFRNEGYLNRFFKKPDSKNSK